MKRTAWPVIVFAAVALIAQAEPMFAQATAGAERPAGGLFGATRPNGPESERLDLSVSLAEAYDDDVYGDLRAGLGPGAVQTRGFYTMFLADAAYARQGTRLQVGASAGSALRYYPELEKVRSVSHTAAIGLSGRLPWRTTLSMNQTAAYSPSYLYGLFPGIGTPALGDALPAAPDYTINDFESYAYGTTLTLERNMERRNALSATGEFRYTDFLHQTEQRPDVRFHAVRGQFRRHLSRNTSLRLGYGYRKGNFQYTTAGAMTEHSLDAGFDYARPLSARRRARVGFTLGSSVADTPEPSAGRPLLGRLYRFRGDAMLGYDIGQSWQARATYRRGYEYVAEFPEPVFVDGATAALSGLFGRRLEMRVTGAYSTGESALRRDGFFFDTYTGNLRFQYALSRSFAAYAEYLYYFYDFRGNTQGQLAFPDELERNGARIGITLWLPVAGR